MAGAIASHRRLIGVAPGARILAINAFGTDGDSAYGTTEQILKGIDWAIAKGARAVWMPEGIVNDDAAAKGRAAGLSVVMDRCAQKELSR